MSEFRVLSKTKTRSRLGLRGRSAAPRPPQKRPPPAGGGGRGAPAAPGGPPLRVYASADAPSRLSSTSALGVSTGLQNHLLTLHIDFTHWRPLLMRTAVP